ncbi:velvet factor [Entophlyctis helioformis]|nr:velvet factor [Entophlyctis helioformis]
MMLHVRQQPVQARMCGTGDKDRRVIDPPPILELVCADEQQRQLLLQDMSLVVHASLWTADGSHMLVTSSKMPDGMALLTGTLVSGAHVLVDHHNSCGVFFIFPDLSVRIEGQFRLKFMLLRVNTDLPFLDSGTTLAPATSLPSLHSPSRNSHSSQSIAYTDGSRSTNSVDDLTGYYAAGYPVRSSSGGIAPGTAEQQAGYLVTSVLTEPFSVFSPRNFPGMLDSSDISKAFAAQGVKLMIRHSKDKSRDRASSSSVGSRSG